MRLSYYLVTAVLMFASGYQLARASDVVEEESMTLDPVGRRRVVLAPRCEKCPGHVKLCCPDCSIYVNKACVCDCDRGRCACQ